MSKPITITTTPERAAALLRFFEFMYLGHNPTQTLVREMIADVERTLKPEPTAPR